MTTDKSVQPTRTDVDEALLGGATYRSLGEQKLSPAEERFERARRTTGLWLAPLVAIVFLALPLDMAAKQQTLAGILLGVIVLWITEPIPIPVSGFIGVSAIVLLGVAPATDALAPFGSSTVFTFIGAFILAQAMLKYGLARRFAFRVLALPGVGKTTTRTVIAFGAITCLLSAFVSNTATVAMLLPTALGMLAVILLLLNKPEIRRIEGVEEYVRTERAALGRLSRAEWNTLIAFGVTVFLWIFPGIVALAAGTDSSIYETVSGRLNEGIVAVLGASLLFVLPVDWGKREYTLNWSDAARIDWGTIVLFGTGIIFGSLLEDTGLAKTIGESSSDALGLTSTFGITAFAVVLAILVSETTSNTASAAVVVPIIIPIAAAAGVDPLVPALAATFAASFGFMLPVSTPQNAIAYGSGAVPITTMIRSGFTFDIAGAILILIGLPIMASLTGIA